MMQVQLDSAKTSAGPLYSSSVDRAPGWCLGGHGFDSCRGLRFFLHPMLMSCRLHVPHLSQSRHVRKEKGSCLVIHSCKLPAKHPEINKEMESNTSELKNLIKELEKKEVKFTVAQRRERHLVFLQS